MPKITIDDFTPISLKQARHLAFESEMVDSWEEWHTVEKTLVVGKLNTISIHYNSYVDASGPVADVLVIPKRGEFTDHGWVTRLAGEPSIVPHTLYDITPGEENRTITFLLDNIPNVTTYDSVSGPDEAKPIFLETFSVSGILSEYTHIAECDHSDVITNGTDEDNGSISITWNIHNGIATVVLSGFDGEISEVGFKYFIGLESDFVDEWEFV